MAKLPAAFVENAVGTLDRWWDRAGVLTTSEGARAAMQATLSRSLLAGDLGTVPLAYIIAMANAGHEPAQLALRTWIGSHIDQKRFNDLPVQAQAYAHKVMLEPVLSGYGRGNKIIDTWTRDIVINYLVRATIARWGVKKAQAAYLVALVLKRRGIKPASTRQVLDIFKNRGSLAERLVRFMLAEIPDDGPTAIPAV